MSDTPVLDRNYSDTHGGNNALKQQLKSMCLARAKERREALQKQNRKPIPFVESDPLFDFEAPEGVSSSESVLDMLRPTNAEDQTVLHFLKEALETERLNEAKLLAQIEHFNMDDSSIGMESEKNSQEQQAQPKPCPNCSNSLKYHKSVIFCTCGLKLDTWVSPRKFNAEIVTFCFLGKLC